MAPQEKPPTNPPTSPAPEAAKPLRVSSAELLAGHNTLEIEHGGQRYLLRVTRENKLILTK